MPPAPSPAGRPHAAHYLASAVALVFCVVLLYQAAREARGVLARYRTGVLLQGTVAQRHEIGSSARSQDKRSIEYTVRATYQGRAVQVVNHFRSSPGDYQVGQRVPVVYVPGQPIYSRLATSTEQYGRLLQLLGFGLLSGLAAALLWLRRLTAGVLFGGRSKPSGAV